MAYINKITTTQQELDAHNGDTLFLLDNEITHFNEMFPNCERVQTVMRQLGPLEFELATIYNIVGELTDLEKALLGVNDYTQ